MFRDRRKHPSVNRYSSETHKASFLGVSTLAQRPPSLPTTMPIRSVMTLLHGLYQLRRCLQVKILSQHWTILMAQVLTLCHEFGLFDFSLSVAPFKYLKGIRLATQTNSVSRV